MFHDLASENERTRKTSGIVQSKSHSLRTRVVSGLKFQPKTKSPRTGKAGIQGRKKWMSQLQQREQIHPFFVFLFYLEPLWTNGYPPTLVSDLLYLVSQIFSRNTLTDTPEIIFWLAIWASFSPVKWTHKINHNSPISLSSHLPHSCLRELHYPILYWHLSFCLKLCFLGNPG